MSGFAAQMSRPVVVDPTIEEISGTDVLFDPRLIRQFDARGGYLKPAECDQKIVEIDGMLRDDLRRVGSNA
jgi:hypothetical protein